MHEEITKKEKEKAQELAKSLAEKERLKKAAMTKAITKNIVTKLTKMTPINVSDNIVKVPGNFFLYMV